MAKYRLNKDHYLQVKKPGAKADDPNPWLKEPQLHEHGTMVEWDGKPSLQMEPVDKEAKERVDARRAEWNDRKAAARQGRSTVGWTPQFAQNMERIITRSTETDAPPVALAGSGKAAGRRGRKAA